MSISHELQLEIEAAAKALNIAPSTVGERAGQGGHFYQRLRDGKRVWPETANTVREKISQMLSPPVCSTDVASPKDVGTPAGSFKGKANDAVTARGDA